MVMSDSENHRQSRSGNAVIFGFIKVELIVRWTQISLLSFPELDFQIENTSPSVFADCSAFYALVAHTRAHTHTHTHTHTPTHRGWISMCTQEMKQHTEMSNNLNCSSPLTHTLNTHLLPCSLFPPQTLSLMANILDTYTRAHTHTHTHTCRANIALISFAA